MPFANTPENDPMHALTFRGGPRLIPWESNWQSPMRRPDGRLMYPNVIIIYGFPWYCTERNVWSYLKNIYPDVEPKTTRLYTFSHNGASRGICFVEYPEEVPSAALKQPYNTAQYYPREAPRPPTSSAYSGFQNDLALHSSGTTHRGVNDQESEEMNHVDLTLVQHHVAANPFEQKIFLSASLFYLTEGNWSRGGPLPPLPSDPPQSKLLIGYGEEGRVARCGSHAELPNTCISADAWNKVEKCRKRLRAALEKQNRAKEKEEESE